MNGLQEMVLIGEIALQSKIALRALKQLRDSENTSDQAATWGAIQSILLSAGKVSKILWPRKKYAERGEKLRQLLKIGDNNPLSDREFRNHFEHYDERIEDWFSKYSSGVYIDLAMNPSFRESTVTNVHRGYNSFDNTLLFRGKSFDLNELSKVLDSILDNCKPYVLI